MTTDQENTADARKFEIVTITRDGKTERRKVGQEPTLYGLDDFDEGVPIGLGPEAIKVGELAWIRHDKTVYGIRRVR